MANLTRKSESNTNSSERNLYFVNGHLLLKRTNNRFRFKAKEKNSGRETK